MFYSSVVECETEIIINTRKRRDNVSGNDCFVGGSNRKSWDKWSFLFEFHFEQGEIHF